MVGCGFFVLASLWLVAQPDVSRGNEVMDHRYIVVFGACLTQFTVIGLLFCYGLLFPIFEQEFGWSRTAISTGNALSMLMMGVLAIPAGRLSDRFGPRIVLGSSAVIYGLGWVFMSGISELWQLYAICGVLLAVGMSTHDVVTLGTIARWFENRRGLMTGVVKVGTASGQMALPPIMAAMLLVLGWRETLLILGVAAGALLVIAAFMMKPAPKPLASQAAQTSGQTFAQARGGRLLWTLCVIQFLFFPVMSTIPLHIVVHGMDLGMAATQAAFLLSVMAGASIAGRLGVGLFADRIGGRRAYQICFVPLIAALLAFVVIETHWALFAMVAVYGFAHGGFFTVVSPTVAEFFGTRAHGAIFGVVLFCGTIGGAIGPIVAGWIFDTRGSYDLAFGGLAFFAAIGLGLVMTLPRKA